MVHGVVRGLVRAQNGKFDGARSGAWTVVHAQTGQFDGAWNEWWGFYTLKMDNLMWSGE